MKLDQLKVPANHNADDDVEKLRQLIATLTPREQEVLRLLAEGVPPKEIAARLGTKLQTVRNQRSSIMRKMDASSEIHLVRMWLHLQAQRDSARP